MSSLRPSTHSASRAWELTESHAGIYSGGKCAVAEWGSPILGCLYSEDVALVNVTTGQLITMLQGGNGDAEVTEHIAPGEAITSFCLNPHKCEVVTTSRGMLLRQWVVNLDASGHEIARCIRSIKCHSEPVLCMNFDSSGCFVATGSADRTARVWDMRGGFATHNFRGHGGLVSLVQFHPDPKRLLLVTGSEDGATKVWSLLEKACVATLGHHMSAVTSVAFSGNGNMMATGSRDKVVNFWETDQFSLLKTLPVFEEVEGLTFIEDGNAGIEGDAANEESGEVNDDAAPVRKKMKSAESVPESLPSSSRLVIVGYKGIARAWNFEHKDTGSKNDQLRCTLVETQPPRKGPASPYMALAFNSTRKPLLIAATADHNLVFLHPLTLVSERQIVGYNDEVSAVKFVNESGGGSDSIAVATNSPLLKLLRIKDMSCDVLEGHTGSILSVDVCPAGKWVATGSKDRTARLWEVATGACVMVCVGHTQAVAAVALSRKLQSYATGNAFFFTGSGDRTLKRWKLLGQKEKANQLAADAPAPPFQPTSDINVRAHEKDINHICVAPNDSLVATSSQDKTVKLWSTSDLSLVATLRGHKRGVMALSFSRVGQVAATCSADRTVKVWSLAPRDGFTCLKTFQGHSGSVLGVEFLNTGTQLVSTGADGLLKLWTIKTNECEATYDAHTDKAWGLSVSNDGQHLVTGGADSVINVWKDVTAALEDQGVVEAEERRLKEHDLMASIQEKDFQQAVELAFELKHSYRLWGVLSEIMDASSASESGGDGGIFDMYVEGWTDERIVQCLEFIVEWNKNAAKSCVAQGLLGSVLRHVPLERLRKLDRVRDIVGGLIPYTERHFQRIDRLVQASFVIDYTGAAISAVGACDDEGAKEASF
eukprot:CAMPEP_0171912904 /NCGR_PEP_ID=MMETSP0993-20121228/11422_1 /TAXON_ID=483369 /ORGANISM="non described non described, Strain CCMP2098" /LENGTH=881 /DNA_ID=CAMNT_0012546823 /DNA_START=1 /DNA_END=2646 /DNA_ORIENTATION=-